jgi:3',5'-cyclic AMP phosphodiesterase CpdA
MDMAKRSMIHLSDLHIGLRSKDSRFTKRIFKKIGETHPGTPVIVAGDLTDSATEEQFKEARRSLRRLAKTNPILTVPGNHDYAWKGNILREEGWENWVKYLGRPLGWGRPAAHWMGVDHEPKGIDGLGVWKDGPLVYFGIDSGDPEDKVVSARGYISGPLADALKRSLMKYEGRTRIAVLHHHPFTEGFFTELKGSRRLWAALRNRCELLLFGHHHEYGLWWHKRGVPLIVASHKSTDMLSGECLMYTIIDVHRAGSPDVSLSHRLEIV